MEHSTTPRRQRFFSSEGCHELPLTSAAPLIGTRHSFTFSNRLPEKSFSAGANPLRKRWSPKRTRSRDEDIFIMTPYGLQPATPNSSISFQWAVQALSSVACVLFCVLGFVLYEQNLALQRTLELRNDEIGQHLAHSDMLEKTASRLRSETFHLHQEVEALEKRPQTDSAELQRQVFHMESYQLSLQTGIQESAKRSVQEKFGPGPHYYVEIKLNFPGSGNSVILLETAPLDAMPHTIHHFLEQVFYGLYDHSAFHSNVADMLQAGPSDYTAYEALRLHPSLQSLLFSESSPTFSQEQYGVGYQGALDFSIRFKHQHNNADPSFARVVQGMDAVDKLHQRPVVRDVLVEPVGIEHMRVLSRAAFQQRIQNPKAEFQSLPLPPNLTQSGLPGTSLP